MPSAFSFPSSSTLLFFSPLPSSCPHSHPAALVLLMHLVLLAVSEYCSTRASARAFPSTSGLHSLPQLLWVFVQMFASQWDTFLGPIKSKQYPSTPGHSCFLSSTSTSLTWRAVLLASVCWHLFIGSLPPLACYHPGVGLLGSFLHCSVLGPRTVSSMWKHSVLPCLMNEYV